MEVATNMEKSKAGSFMKMPKLSRTSRWILSLGTFIIIFFLLFTLTNQEKAKGNGLQSTLDASMAKAVSPAQDINVLQDTLVNEQRLLKSAQDQFPDGSSTVQMIDNFIKLATSCGLQVTSSQLTIGAAKVTGGEAGVSYYSHNYTLKLEGEVARVQNFILGLSRFPTVEIMSITINPAIIESGVDTATISINCIVKDK